MVLAFFIYGIFSPSWAARLWYNVRTFPQRMAGWMSNSSEFLDYDSYKSKISSIWNEIWDKIWDKIGLADVELDLDDKTDIDIDENIVVDEKNIVDKNVEKKSDYQLDGKQIIKSFPRSVKLIEIPKLEWGKAEENESEIDWAFTWYSKSDLIWVINKYIEKNLDDDTDILVTVEYEDDSGDPQKIILQTQQKSSSGVYRTASSKSLVNDLFE